jgi:sugar (glycoside-pentoside-hexuronide) transporter
MAAATPSSPGSLPHLGPGRKSVYALGDFTIGTGLAALSLIYATYFLTQIADLRPLLAGLVPLVGRAVDAFTDPLMGRISDQTRWRSGRRRPYFLLGAIPYGISFALLWSEAPFDSQLGIFAWYTFAYCLLSVSATVLSVPYLAILPEMATDYDDRTSLNTYRTVGATLGVFGAVSIRPVAEAFGGGPTGYALVGLVFGIALALPWLAVHRVTFERADARAMASETSFRQGLRTVFSHATFTRLTWLYIFGRIAMDLSGALLILFITYWLGRTEDFELVMLIFLSSVMLALPFWLKLSRGRDKAVIFVWGSAWWMLVCIGQAFIQPDWPRWVFMFFIPLAGAGFALVDLMPWSMLGEVIDEDELHSRERREGIYNGVFTFLRKLGGALGVFLVMSILDVAGFRKGEEQTELVRQTIRFLSAGGPAFFLALAIWMARDYPLTRAAHARIREVLASRSD